MQRSAVVTVPKRRKPTSRGTWALLLLALPGVIWFLVFAYGPMAGLVVAFKDFNISQGIFGSAWNPRAPGAARAGSPSVKGSPS